MKWITDEDYAIWPEYVKIGEIVYPPGGSLGPRIQPTIEFIIIYEGEMNVLIDNINYFAESNSVTMMLPGHQEFYRFSKNSQTYHRYVHISIQDLPSKLKKYLSQVPKTIPLSEEMDLLMDMISNLKHSILGTQNQIRKSIALQIFWRFIGEGEKQFNLLNVTPPNDIISCACSYIKNNLEEEISLKMIAEKSAVCSEHLIRVFKEIKGKTPMDYLWEQRVKKGIVLLENSGLPISMISDQCGFKTRNHFCRKVKEFTGFPPKEIRNRFWKQISIR